MDGFLRVAAVTPEIQVANPVFNREKICEKMEEGARLGVGIMVFPELCLTGYTCGDLFLQQPLIQSAREQLRCIEECTRHKEMLVFVGMPWEYGGKLYNVAAAIHKGHLIGIVPKTHLPNYSEFYEQRHFAAGSKGVGLVSWEQQEVPFGTQVAGRSR